MTPPPEARHLGGRQRWVIRSAWKDGEAWRVSFKDLPSWEAQDAADRLIERGLIEPPGARIGYTLTPLGERVREFLEKERAA